MNLLCSANQQHNWGFMLAYGAKDELPSMSLNYMLHV